MLEYFIDHRQVVVTRRTQFDLRIAKERAHILEGLKKALDHIDAVIDTIRKSATKEIAHDNLMKKFKLSDKQSTAILEMRLQTLAGLERKKIEDELKEKMKLIKELEELLKSPKKILGVIKTELARTQRKIRRRTTDTSREIGGGRIQTGRSHSERRSNHCFHRRQLYEKNESFALSRTEARRKRRDRCDDQRRRHN